MPEKRASPTPSIGTSLVSSSASLGPPPALQTTVPVTAVTGPGVPLKVCPLITSPCTSKLVLPVARSTRARPARTDHGNVPLLTLPTGLLMFSAASVVRSSGAVITPTMLLQRTSANDDDAHSAASMKPTSATLLVDFCFMTDSLSMVDVASRNTNCRRFQAVTRRRTVDVDVAEDRLR